MDLRRGIFVNAELYFDKDKGEGRVTIETMMDSEMEEPEISEVRFRADSLEQAVDSLTMAVGDMKGRI